MKQQWRKLAARINALSLRERLMVFLAAAAALAYVLWMLFLTPLHEQQQRLRGELARQQGEIQAVEADIAAKMAAYQADPNADGLARLAALRQERDGLRTGVASVSTSLVGPGEMVPMLQRLVAANRGLTLVSLKSLPVSGLTEAAPPVAAGTPAAAANTEKPREVLYRHGVELVLQGGYLQMIDYMDALHALPTQLYWGRVELDAAAYPKAQLTLTLYTLSLDDKWMIL